MCRIISQRNLSTVSVLTALVLNLGFLVSCITNNPTQTKNSKPMDWEPKNPEFRSFYGWDEKAGSWKMERIPDANGGSVAMHVFRPPLFKWRRGTVFLLHGYLEHTALRVPLVLEFVRKGWIVVGIDLPGHGLSTGKRADIDDFSDYLAAFEAAMSAHFWLKPWRVVGHSTGGAVILMAMQESARKFDLVVLEAPLIRTFMWAPSLWLKKLFEDSVTTVSRRTGTSRDGEPFQKIMESDPFYVSEVPLHWVDAVEAYYEATLNWVPVRGRVLILQGKDDTVVDAKYNLEFLGGLLLDAEIIEITEGRHHLLIDGGPAGDAAHQELFIRWQGH